MYEFLQNSNMLSIWISSRLISVITTEIIYVMHYKVTSNYDRNVWCTKKKRRGAKIKKCTLRKETEMQRRSNETAGFATIKKYKKRLQWGTNVKKDTETGTERNRKARGAGRQRILENGDACARKMKRIKGLCLLWCTTNFFA